MAAGVREPERMRILIQPGGREKGMAILMKKLSAAMTGCSLGKQEMRDRQMLRCNEAVCFRSEHAEKGSYALQPPEGSSSVKQAGQADPLSMLQGPARLQGIYASVRCTGCIYSRICREPYPKRKFGQKADRSVKAGETPANM